MTAKLDAARTWMRALALLTALFLAVPSLARASGDARVGAGEVCLLCGTELDSAAAPHVHRGRKVALCAACEPVFERDPDAAFAALQPKGALFQEGERGHVVPSPWFWFGSYVLVGLVSGAAAAYAAVNRGRSPLPWFAAGLVANVAALAVLFASSREREVGGVPRGFAKVPLTRAARPCAACGARMHPAASKCPGCGARIVPLVDSEVERAHEA